MSVAGRFGPASTALADGVGTEQETFSPFGEIVPEEVPSPTRVGPTPEPAMPTLESPFATGFTRELDRGEAELFAEAVRDTVTELEDEDFTDVLEALVDEAAARQLADTGSWSAPPSAGQAHALLEQWIEPLASQAERALDSLAERFGELDPHTVAEGELAQLLDAPGEYDTTGNEVFDNFLGGLIRKARKAVSGAVSLARRGIDAVGKLLPINVLLGRLKAMVRPLLNRVLQAAIGRLPASVQPIARTLAGKLGLGGTGEAAGADHEDTVGRLAEDFDTSVAGLLLAPQAELPMAESAFGTGEERDPAGELDDARARLAQQLSELPAGSSPAAEIEQFIPAALAIRPLIKLGVSMIGRDRIVGFVADRVAALVQPLIGAEGARQLSRPLVDVGLRALGFEAPASQDTLAGEALASTVEGTVLRLTELSAEAFADELQLEAAIRSAFAEAAAASVPAQLLRADLPERETAGEAGVWILMPRSARPYYRYRRYSRAIAVPITRQVARAVPWSDGGTLESHLLDRGVETWPVPAEVHLYEALPGTQLGHLVADETAGAGLPSEAADELQPLTPEVAGLLLREPGLGRAGLRSAVGSPHRQHRRPWPGRRYYRLRPLVGGAGPATRRPRRRLAIRLDLAGPAPALRVMIRLTEGQGHQLLNRLDPAARRGAPDLPGALAELTGRLRAALPARLVRRLVRGGVVADATAATPVVDRVLNGVVAALSGFLAQRAHLLSAAMRDPAPGATILVTFPGITKQSLATALPAGQITVTPGWGRHG